MVITGRWGKTFNAKVTVKNEIPAQTVTRFLRANGLNLGGLTGQDLPALRAAAEILYCYNRCDQDAEAGW